MSEKKKIAETIQEYAVDRYGDPTRRKVRPPLDQLVESVLWRRTSIRRGTRAFRQLNREFADWNEMRVSHTEEISRTMATTEWAADSARVLNRIMSKIFDLRHKMDLDFLRDLTKAQARAFLLSLPGVTADMADEVLLFSTDVSPMPVNQDTARMAYRLGLVPNARVTKKNQQRLTQLWDSEILPAIDQFFVDYGPDVCRKEDVRCQKCPMEELCPREGLSE
ncbi:MAG: hypothetical protein ACOCR1_02910 [Planctomycetota bacterium]